jgi:hypothetical protein
MSKVIINQPNNISVKGVSTERIDRGIMNHTSEPILSKFKRFLGQLVNA